MDMPFDAQHLQAPFQKLAKSMSSGRNRLADPERVHKLRTNTRRVEAIVGALHLEKSSRERKLLRSLKQIRRAAGVVRDMDVLTIKAAEVALQGEAGCQVRLLEHLGVQRHREAGRLRRLLRERRKSVRRALQRYEEDVKPLLGRPASKSGDESHAAARALELSSRLQSSATLGRSNLHDFRKQGKQLRYVLQMAKPQDAALLKALEEMQDAIGEWHDWEELVSIAKDALDHPNCGLVRELQLHADESFDSALRNANAVRRRYLTKRGNRPSLQIVRDSATLAA